MREGQKKMMVSKSYRKKALHLFAKKDFSHNEN